VKKDVKMPVQGRIFCVALFTALLLYSCAVRTIVMLTLNNGSCMQLMHVGRHPFSVSGFTSLL